MGRSFIEIWSLGFDDMEFVGEFNRLSRVWVAFQLCFFRHHGRFPSREGDAEVEVLRYLAQQLDEPMPAVENFQYGHVNARRQRAAILRQLGIRRAFDRDRQALRRWVSDSCARSACSVAEQMDAGYLWCLGQGLFVPSDKIMERLVRGGQHDFVETTLAAITERLADAACQRLEASLASPKEPTGFYALKNDVGAASLANILAACGRLSFVEGLALPFDIFAGIDPAWLRRLSRRVDGETAL